MNPVASQGKHDTKLILKCKGEYSSLLFSASILQKAREDVDTAGISNYAFSQLQEGNFMIMAFLGDHKMVVEADNCGLRSEGGA